MDHKDNTNKGGNLHPFTLSVFILPPIEKKGKKDLDNPSIHQKAKNKGQNRFIVIASLFTAAINVTFLIRFFPVNSRILAEKLRATYPDLWNGPGHLVLL